MRRLHEKSIVLGIGIGMIITSIAGMIYSAGTQKELTREEIISKAKAYGLIEPTTFINNNTSDNTKAALDKNTSNNTETANETSSNTSTTSEKADETTTPNNAADKTGTNNQQEPEKSENLEAERNISIAVQRGFGSKQVAKLLLEKGVITSEAEFDAALASYKATQKIRTGTYLFKKNEDLDYIVKTICKFK
ncbi:ABC transporter substrate-binding protein [Ruminiclostridium herbifermentans]|uniref:ABC transporter substrate-binding protein n=1 Tax=Ruminiclostridium herbifermentans TaxID=2488810 RepID=A0A4U7JJD4_9FIRM|nr:endolytic transglycosylase MltG [Ruminiclostridium herbifermentans]QNU68414.1 ABC transporter substrate-binding protein [Ruminiclostridium herbifermentans]